MMIDLSDQRPQEPNMDITPYQINDVDEEPESNPSQHNLNDFKNKMHVQSI